MHRRQFISMFAGAAALSPFQTVAQQDATPAATPEHHGRPRPLVLGDGIELVDYRIFPSQGVRRIIGEISSTRDDMVDSPVVSITFPDIEGGDGFAYAPAVLPVMQPGQSNMIFGVLPDQIDSQEHLASASFGLCAPVNPGEYTKRHAGVVLKTDQNNLEILETAVTIEGRIYNEGDATAQYTTVRGLVRDQFDRYAGCTTTSATGNIAARSSKEYALWASTAIDVPANPYVLLSGTLNYRVEVTPGLIGPLTAPGCSSAFLRG